jgi:hypothetical protein
MRPFWIAISYSIPGWSGDGYTSTALVFIISTSKSTASYVHPASLIIKLRKLRSQAAIWYVITLWSNADWSMGISANILFCPACALTQFRLAFWSIEFYKLKIVWFFPNVLFAIAYIKQYIR